MRGPLVILSYCARLLDVCNLKEKSKKSTIILPHGFGQLIRFPDFIFCSLKVILNLLVGGGKGSYFFHGSNDPTIPYKKDYFFLDIHCYFYSNI